tara:strand:- start:899 stop:1411 length:513 start_codon:yes stop_codon:yes gene_type:complete
MGVCTCIGLICKHKNKLPIKISPEEKYDKTICYSIEPKNENNIYKLKKDIDDFKKIIDRLYIENKGLEIYNEKKEKEIEDWIEPSIRFIFGKGEIRYKQNGKYYHGIGINENQKWNKGTNYYDKCFWEGDGEKVWDTNNVKDFCKNCSFDKEKTGKKRKYKVYKCNGHVL